MSLNWTVGFSASLLVLAIIIGLFLGGIERNKRRRTLKNREPIPDQIWFDSFYGNCEYEPESVISARNSIANILGVDPSLLYPADEIRKLTGIPEWIGTAQDIDDLEYELMLHCSDDDRINNIKTIGDVIEILIADTGRKRSAIAVVNIP